MADESLDTTQLNGHVARWQAGDRTAAEDLIRTVGTRLETLARGMLKRFPNVRGLADTGDVLQGGLLRLLNTLRALNPTSTRHFYNLAATNLRRELLDLARRAACRPDLENPQSTEGVAEAVTDPAAPSGDLELWCRFHEAVEGLPVEEREVVGLVFYHGWEQKQIAELFGVSERTVRRLWRGACVRLQERLGGALPET